MQEIRPQEGAQERFLSSDADIIFYGGAAGGGKTMALLLESLRHVNIPKFRFVIFRRDTKQIKNPGGLWDAAKDLYIKVGAECKETALVADFPSGASGKFSHLEYEKDKYSWQGAELAFIGFDEVTHFTKSQFFYLMTRNRSTCGVKPYIRATCNPDSDSWVKELISWWLDENGEYPDKSKAGIVRYFVNISGSMFWEASPEELYLSRRDYFDDLIAQSTGSGYKDFIKSFTFIPSNIQDNKILMQTDPSYMANLLAQDPVHKEQLLNGNWKIKPSAGNFFRREWFDFVQHVPKTTKICRCWDLAATEITPQTPDPDRTASVKLGLGDDGYFYVLNVTRDALNPGAVEKLIIQTALDDGRAVPLSLPQDPGQAGKTQAWHYKSNMPQLNGYIINTYVVRRDKVTRASPVSALASRRQIKIVLGHWNEAFLSELENFPDGKHDDQVDALSDAWLELSQGSDAIAFLKNMVK